MDLPKRVHALDAVRGVMMLLGLVIHASVTYASRDYGAAWPLKDPDNTMAFDLVVTLIHAFRMPLFFITAGYFGALLFFKKGPKAMIIHRVRRILIPFLVSLFILYPLVIMGFTYSLASFDGNPSPLRHMLASISWKTIFPFSVIHLWFLYFLMLYCTIGWLLGLMFRKRSLFTIGGILIFRKLFQNIWFRYLVLTLLFFLCLYRMETFSIPTNTSWKIDPYIFITYFIFFGTGWMLFLTNTLDKLKKWPVQQLVLAVILFIFSEMVVWPHEPGLLPVKQICVAIYTCLLIFGLISLFLTRFNDYSSRLAYLMEASYWVYIVHLPIVAFVPGLLAHVALAPVMKFVITLSVSTLLSFCTYHWFVRNKGIGNFLNGKWQNQSTPVSRKKILSGI